MRARIPGFAGFEIRQNNDLVRVARNTVKIPDLLYNALNLGIVRNSLIVNGFAIKNSIDVHAQEFFQLDRLRCEISLVLPELRLNEVNCPSLCVYEIRVNAAVLGTFCYKFFSFSEREQTKSNL